MSQLIKNKIEDHPRLVLNLLCSDDKSNLEVTEKKTLPMPQG